MFEDSDKFDRAGDTQAICVGKYIIDKGEDVANLRVWIHGVRERGQNKRLISLTGRATRRRSVLMKLILKRENQRLRDEGG